MSTVDSTTIRLLFVDAGVYREEEIEVPTALLGEYDRLIDLLREDPDILKRIHMDLDRLCSARVT